MVSVRCGCLSDRDILLRELKKFDQFAGLNIFPPDDIALEKLTHLIEKHVVFVAEKEGFGVVGFIGGTLAPHGMNPFAIVLGEMFWWVAEEHRGGLAGAKLLREFLDLGERSADLVTMSLLAKSPIEASHLERLGFQKVETSYAYVPARSNLHPERVATPAADVVSAPNQEAA